MSGTAKSTGLMTVAGAANVPTPCQVTGYDVIDGPGAVLIYDGTDANGTLISHHNAATFAVIDFDVPVRCTTGVYVDLESANTVVRYR